MDCHTWLSQCRRHNRHVVGVLLLDLMVEPWTDNVQNSNSKLYLSDLAKILWANSHMKIYISSDGSQAFAWIRGRICLKDHHTKLDILDVLIQSPEIYDRPLSAALFQNYKVPWIRGFGVLVLVRQHLFGGDCQFFSSRRGDGKIEINSGVTGSESNPVAYPTWTMVSTQLSVVISSLLERWGNVAGANTSDLLLLLLNSMLGLRKLWLGCELWLLGELLLLPLIWCSWCRGCLE